MKRSLKLLLLQCVLINQLIIFKDCPTGTQSGPARGALPGRTDEHRTEQKGSKRKIKKSIDVKDVARFRKRGMHGL